MRGALALLLLLGACVSPRVEYREVLVPVNVPCMNPVGPRPEYADTEEAVASAPDILDRVKLILVGREQRNARLNVLEGQADACAPKP